MEKSKKDVRKLSKTKEQKKQTTKRAGERQKTVSKKEAVRTKDKGKKQKKRLSDAKQTTPSSSAHANKRKAVVTKPQKQANTRDNQKALSAHARKKRHRYRKRRQKRRNLLVEIGISLTIFFVLVGTVSFLTFRIVKVDGYAMTPTLNDQDQLFVYKWGKIKRFSLVALTPSSSRPAVTRRVIGLPGETIRYEKGQLYVNEEEVVERFFSSLVQEGIDEPLTEDFTLSQLSSDLKVIPEGSYLVLGDNRPYASDSRSFGLVKEDQIVGVVTARVFPLHSLRQF